MEDMRTLIAKAAGLLDPARQGDQWPDPIQWDGRPLDEQARDICVLLDARAEDLRARGLEDKAAEIEALSARLWQAAHE